MQNGSNNGYALSLRQAGGGYGLEIDMANTTNYGAYIHTDQPLNTVALTYLYAQSGGTLPMMYFSDNTQGASIEINKDADYAGGSLNGLYIDVNNTGIAGLSRAIFCQSGDIVINQNFKLYLDGGTNTYLSYNTGTGKVELYVGGALVQDWG